MSNPTESNPSLGPLLPLYNTSTGQTNIAWDVDPATVATDAEGVTHGKAQISGSFSSTPPAGVVSSVNSSSTLLLANAVFTGTSESILAYGSVSVQAYTDVASAAGGLVISQSQDGTNWDTKASYSVAAATPFQATVNATGQFLQVKYTNGAGNQTVFRLQTIKEINASPSAGVANQRVNALSGDFATGSIVDLTTLIANTADLLADGEHLATIDTSTAAAKTDLDTIVTNTNKIPASPAQEGGNLASVATVAGATGDTAVTGDNTGTLSAKLRGLTKMLADIWDSVNHRIKVDGSGVTQPVSGTVTANAGTNMSTASLALETGGNLATIQTNTANIPAKGAAITSASTPVNIASDQIVPGKRSSVAVYSLPSTAETVNGNSGDVTVGPYTEISIDVNATAGSGTSPTLQLFWDRKGADGVYYPIWQSAVLSSFSSTTYISTSIGAGMAYNQSLSTTGRLRWALTGVTPSVTFSANVTGK